MFSSQSKFELSIVGSSSNWDTVEIVALLRAHKSQFVKSMKRALNAVRSYLSSRIVVNQEAELRPALRDYNLQV